MARERARPAPDSPPWVDGRTIGAVLTEIATRHAEREALVFPRHDCRISWSELDLRVDDAARALMALDVQVGDRVAVWSTNRPEWVVLQLATARVGAVLVTVNPAWRADELRYVLRQSGAKVLFVGEPFKRSDYFALTAEALPELAEAAPGEGRSEHAPALRWVVGFRQRPPSFALSWRGMLARGDRVERAELEARAADLEPGQPINLQYTSGTTGFPKGALLSHRNLLLNAWYVGERQGLSEQDRVCSPVPLFHCFGCVIGVLACVVRGATLLVPAEYFDPEATLDCIEAERATAVYGVPTMFLALFEHPSFGTRDLSSLRTGVMAGAPCPVELMKKVVGVMGAEEITIAYGLTETSPCATQTRRDDDLRHRVETVGPALPGVEVRVVDLDSGVPCPDEVQGEICIRGHNVMIGYHEMPEATAATIDDDGWLHSGDLGIRDPDGYFRITGRLKDMIIRGGENVYPREIEEVLYRHPAVAAAQVVGVPDERLGEAVAAWVSLHDGARAGADELREFCRANLAHYKVPRDVLFTDEFPVTPSGKVKKFELREMTIERLEAAAAPV